MEQETGGIRVQMPWNATNNKDIFLIIHYLHVSIIPSGVCSIGMQKQTRLPYIQRQETKNQEVISWNVTVMKKKTAHQLTNNWGSV